MRAKDMEFFNPDKIDAALDAVEKIDAELWKATNSQRKQIRSQDRKQVKESIIFRDIK
jgi:hypothetical protein